MSEGGGTPKYVAAVNSIIAEDGDVEPLITGLINVSALLANLVAGAFGTSPEGLVWRSSRYLRPVRSTDPGGCDLRGRKFGGRPGGRKGSIYPRQTRPVRFGHDREQRQHEHR